MIKRKLIPVLFISLLVAALTFAVRPIQAGATGGGLAPWPIPDQSLILPTYALGGISGAASAEEAIANAVAALGDNYCDDAVNLVALFIEDAIRRGTALDAPANGVLYADMLQISAEMAQAISGSAMDMLVSAGISLTRPLDTGISFVSGEWDVLNVSFPDDVSGIGFDNITVETEFAAITIGREFISGSALRIERGLPIATGGHTYVAVPGVVNGPVPSGLVPALDVLLDYWSVAVLVVILVVWGVLASKGKKLRLWVVPLLAVILIAANIWTLGPNQEGPDDVIYAPAPVYFYSVVVDMPPEMSAVLSVPVGGATPYMLVLVNEDGVPRPSRYNPFTDAVEAYISVGGKYFLREIDIRG